MNWRESLGFDKYWPWRAALGFIVVGITERFWGLGWASWVLGYIVYELLNPLIPRFVEWRHKQVESVDTPQQTGTPTPPQTSAELESDIRLSGLFRETDKILESDPRILPLLQEMNTLRESDPKYPHLLREVDTLIESDPKLRYLIEEANRAAEGHPRLQRFLRAVNLRPVAEENQNKKKNYYLFLRMKGLKPGQAKALSDSAKRTLMREYGRWRDS